MAKVNQPLYTSYGGYTITVTHAGFTIHDREGDVTVTSMRSARAHVRRLRRRDGMKR